MQMLRAMFPSYCDQVIKQFFYKVLFSYAVFRRDQHGDLNTKRTIVLYHIIGLIVPMNAMFLAT